MSLNMMQLRNTSEELKENLNISALTNEQVCADLGIGRRELSAALDMTGENPTTVWRVRDYLEKTIRDQGKRPHPYSALKTNIWYRYN